MKFDIKLIRKIHFKVVKKKFSSFGGFYDGFENIGDNKLKYFFMCKMTKFIARDSKAVERLLIIFFIAFHVTSKMNSWVGLMD